MRSARGFEPILTSRHRGPTLRAARLAAALVLSALVAACGLFVRDSKSCGGDGFVIDQSFAGAPGSACFRRGPDSVHIDIEPEDAPPINNSPWYAFRVEAQVEKEVTVALHYLGGTHRYHPKISRDGRRWSLLSADRFTVNEARDEARLRLPVVPGNLWVAAQPLRMPRDDSGWMDQQESRELKRHRLGRSAQGRPIDYLESGREKHEYIVLVSGQHPPETTGRDAFRAFAETIWGDTALARRFRERFGVIGVPVLNPDGIVGGFWRHGTGGLDLNRDWGPFTQAETRLVKSLLDDQVTDNRSLRLFLDFHSTWRNLFYTQSDANPTHPAGFSEQWLEAARPRLTDYPFTEEKSRRSPQANSKNYVHGRFGIPAVTYEVGDATPLAVNAAAARVFAEEAMLALLATPPTPPHYDLVLRNATLLDGTGRPRFQSDVALIGERIAALTLPPGATAEQEIDLDGLWLVPGFIDPHTHASSDLREASSRQNVNYLTQGVTTVMIGNDGGGVPGGLARLDDMAAAGVGTNVGFFAGHNRIREAALGREDRAPTADELSDMERRLSDAMERGALGLSTGLYYVPGTYSKTDEVIALARVAAEAGGVYDTHLRSESAVGLLPAVDEALTIGRETGIDVHISHLKALGTDAWGQSQTLIEKVEAARSEGLTVTANQYPWEASGTRFSNALIPRSLMTGSREAMAARLRDPAVLAEHRDEMLAALERRGGPDAMLITGPASPYRGKTLREVAEATGVDPLTAAVAQVLAGDPPIASFVMSPADIAALAIQDWVMTGSDGSSGHPRKYATYPWAYKKFVVEDELMSAERFVRRSSGQVADTFGLCNRGYVAAGYQADLVVIDPQRYVARADYYRATELSEGVRYLWVNGELVIRDSQLLPTYAGRVIRKNQVDC
ncbi:MAG: amidohydrolase family protein [Pseudomonadota bacterium]